LNRKWPAEYWWPLALGILLLLAIAQSFWALTVGFENPIMDEHSFRQTQTALSAFFLAKGGSFFAYETPVLGYPWSIPFELPVYQWLVAKLSLSAGIPLEAAGRFVGRFFFYLALVPLYSLFCHFKFAPVSRCLGLFLYLLSPLYLFWSRSILIESCALFFSLSYAALFARALRSTSWRGWFLAAACGCLAGTTKSTTAFAFFLASGILFCVEQGRSLFSPAKWLDRRILAAVLLGFALPAVVTILWLKFSDAQKALNPLASFILSGNLTQWNFGTWQQRISGDLWYMFFRKTIHSSIGHRTTWLVSLVLLWFLPRRHFWIYIATSLLFLVPPLVFTNLHIAHTYYWYANGIFLLVAMVALVDGLWERAATSRAMLGAFFAFVILMSGLELRQFHTFELTWQRQLNDGPFQTGKFVQTITAESDVLFIPGYGWHPAFAFFSRRRAIMDPESYGLDDPRIREAIRRTEANGFRVALLMMCLDFKNRPELMNRAHAMLDLEPENIGQGTLCDMYRIRGFRQ